jgi:hypothetical protein
MLGGPPKRASSGGFNVFVINILFAFKTIFLVPTLVIHPHPIHIFKVLSHVCIQSINVANNLAKSGVQAPFAPDINVIHIYNPYPHLPNSKKTHGKAHLEP